MSTNPVPWRDAMADAIEAQAEAIAAACLGLERLEGMFQKELRLTVKSTLDLLGTEHANLLKQAEKIKKGETNESPNYEED